MDAGFILLCKYAHDVAGIPNRQHTVRNVLHNDAAAANDHVAADGDARHDLHACADPDIVADRDGTGVLQPLIAPFRVKRMTSRIEPAVRRDKNVVAKGHLCTVKDNRIVVGKEVLADGNVAAVVAPERCKDRKTLASRTEQTAHQLALLRLIGRRCLVVGKTQLLRRDSLPRQLFAACIVEQTCSIFSFSVISLRLLAWLPIDHTTR